MCPAHQSPGSPRFSLDLSWPKAQLLCVSSVAFLGSSGSRRPRIGRCPLGKGSCSVSLTFPSVSPAVLVASQHLGLENIGLVFNLTFLSFLSGSVRLGQTTPTFKWESSCHTDRLGLVLLPGSVLFSAVTGLTLLLRHWLSGRAWLYLWGFRLQGRVCVLPTPGAFVA